MIQVQHISKSYTTGRGTRGVIKALDDVSLVIERGQVHALLGVNGAGKSTLSSLLATLHPPTGGDILYEGVSIYADLERYRRAIGFCPQHPNLDSYLTVYENLFFAGRYQGLGSEAAQVRARELLEQFHLVAYTDASINALSGGYRQRVSIARALVHQPRMIILDEPTVGLDPHIRHYIWDIIRQLRAGGVAVILTTHYLDEAEILADQVSILSNGRLLMTETVQELKEAHDKATLEEVFLELVRAEEQAE